MRTDGTTQGGLLSGATWIEVFRPAEPELAGRLIGVRQMARAEGLGAYPLKTLYVPLEQASELGAALLLAGQEAARRPPAGGTAQAGRGGGRAARRGVLRPVPGGAR